MINFKTYLNEFIQALRAEQKEQEIQSKSTEIHAAFINKFASLKNKPDPQKFKILFGVFKKKKFGRLNFRRYKNSNYSSYQLKAVNGCRRQRISIIWSPPGTGKTKTIARVISNSVKAGKTVLFLSQSNTAVDEGVLEVCDIFKNHGYYSSGKIIRFGNCQEELIERKYAKVLPIKYLHSKLKQLDNQIKDLETKINLLQEKINRILTINNGLKQLKQENQNLRVFKTEFDQTKKDDEHREIKEQAIRRQERKIQDLAEKINQTIKSLNISKRKFSKFKDKYEKQKRELAIKKNRLYDKKNKKEKDYHLKAKIFCTTIYTAISDNNFPNRNFDVLIVDESSMVSMPYIFWALTLCTDSVVFAGDFLQSPPTCISQQADAQKWLTRNIFSFLDLDSVSSLKNSPFVFELK